MLITDSQVHLYLADTPERPWPKGYRGSDPGRPYFLPTDLLPLMEEAGVQRAAIVPPIWAGLDNTPCLDWSQEYPGVFGIMGRFDLHDPNRDRIERWLEQPGMIGIRMSGPTDRGEWLDDQVFGWFWSAAERLDIPVMILASKERIRLLAKLAQHHPNLRIIVDHFGVTIGNPSEIDPWEHIDDVLALAKYPNVWAKLSALALNTIESYPYASQTPYIRRAYDTFGPERLAWGSDGSRFTRSTYKECVDHMLYTLEFLSEADKEWIMGKTIASALNWPEPNGSAGFGSQ
jgi:L-fuconolactonase